PVSRWISTASRTICSAACAGRRADVDVPSDLDWTAPLAERGAVPGLTRPLTIIYTVPKTSEGDLRFVTTFEAPDAAEGGGSADGAEPDEVELTAVPAVAEALRSG